MWSFPTQFRRVSAGMCLTLLAVTGVISGSAAIAQPALTITELRSRAQELDRQMTALNAEIQSLLARCSGSWSRRW